MARDPPPLLASSELRDLDVRPSAVRSANITIVHPQLRDLVLSLERGRVLYPRGNIIEEQRWLPPPGEEDEGAGEQARKGGITGITRPFVKLAFTPNCLTASHEIFACGGQHGELYLSNLPRQSKGWAGTAAVQPRPTIKPFSISLTLPTRSINNSLVILPGWPGEWARREASRKAGFVGAKHRELEARRDADWRDGDEDVDVRIEERSARENADEEIQEEAMDIDEQGGEQQLEREDPDLDEEEYEEDEEDVASPSSVATYPNTVPFIHAPRIPNLPSSRLEIHTTRRHSSSHDLPTSRPQLERASRLSFSARPAPGQPPIQYVTSFLHASSSRSGSMSSSSRPTVHQDPRMRNDATTNDVRSRGGSKEKATPRDEPRMLVSNNDQTVKMFSIRPLAPQRTSYERALQDAPTFRCEHHNHSSSRQTYNDLVRQRARERRMDRENLPPAPTRFARGFGGWDAIGINEGLRALEPGQARRDLDAMEEMARHEERIRAQEMEMRREELASFEHALGMRRSPLSRRSPAPPPSASLDGYGAGARGSRGADSSLGVMEKERQERKLTKVGGTRFKYAINHSSLSPDLKTMVSAGDSPDVYLFEVIEGGREFRKIGVYKAATDAGFSTAWSKDGRKFAVASQDGQVTVWDHRSSQPLAIFHTSSPAPASPPSFTTDLSAHRLPRSPSLSPAASHRSAMWLDADETAYSFNDPVAGDTRLGGSSSGREAARVVKFSPEGSSRDLMVFSEENSNIHIIDAKTFHTHVIIPVPIDTLEPVPLGPRRANQRTGAEGGTWGIAGVAFDPSGEWLYAGTDRTVVEWDMRRMGGGGGEGGVWQMA